MSTPRLDTLTYEQLCELSTRVEAHKARAYKAAEQARQDMRSTLDKMLTTLQGSAVITAATKTAPQPKPQPQPKAAIARPTAVNAPVITPPPKNGQHKRKSTKGRKAPIKFRSGSHTWSGRGKTPAWLQTLERSGQPRSNFAV